VLAVLQLDPGAYRDAFLEVLCGDVDVPSAAAAVRVLVAVLLNRYLTPDILDAAGARGAFLSVILSVWQSIHPSDTIKQREMVSFPTKQKNSWLVACPSLAASLSACKAEKQTVE
jgi:hypothetical protein